MSVQRHSPSCLNLLASVSSHAVSAVCSNLSMCLVAEKASIKAYPRVQLGALCVAMAEGNVDSSDDGTVPQ